MSNNLFPKKIEQNLPNWLKSLNDYSSEKIEKIGILKKSDDFKYSKLFKIVQSNFSLKKSKIIKESKAPNSITIVNSSIANSQIEEGIKVANLNDIANSPAEINEFIENENSCYLTTLNHSLLNVGALVEVDSSPSLPLNIEYLAEENSSMATSINIKVGDGVDLKLIERINSPCQSLISSKIKITLGKGSSVKHLRKFESEGLLASVVEVEMAERSIFRSFNFSKGGEMNRNNFKINFNGEKGDAKIEGLYLCSGSHVDNSILVKHNRPHCKNYQKFKGILDKNASGAFTSMVLVPDGSNGSEATQINKTILLDKDSEMNSRPQLSIFNDDVKCGHGSTIGQLDEAAIFYLQSRGIEREKAIKLISRGFIDEILSGAEDLREEIEQLIEEGEKN